MADSAKERITIDAPVERVFDVITDFERYPQWAPDIKATTVLDRDAEGRAVEVEFRVAAMGRSVSVHLRYDFSEAPGALSWTLVEGDTVKRYDGSYRLREGADGDGSTDVDYELTVELTVALPAYVKRRAEHRIMKAALPELKSHIESGAASGQR